MLPKNGKRLTEDTPVVDDDERNEGSGTVLIGFTLIGLVLE